MVFALSILNGKGMKCEMKNGILGGTFLASRSMISLDEPGQDTPFVLPIQPCRRDEIEASHRDCPLIADLMDQIHGSLNA